MAGGSLKYINQAQDLIKKIDPILIKRSICSDTNDCIKKEVLFIGWYSWGILVQTYGIKDGRVLSEVLDACTGFFFEHQSQIKLEVEIYTISKAEELKILLPWDKPKPIKIIMKDE
jgi:hypothetical protein